MSTVYGNAPPQVEGDDYNSLVFTIQQWIMNNVQTAKIVRVIACSNSGGVSRAGTVTVLPLINGMTAQRNPLPHGQLYNVPYLRMQGGTNAVILDPAAGDVGVAIFSDRDISSLKKALMAGNTGQQNPGSFRAYDWADGLYLGGFLNATPTTYVQFTGGGINVVSPSQVTVMAPTITLQGDVTVTGTLDIDGLTTAQEIDAQFVDTINLTVP